MSDDGKALSRNADEIRARAGTLDDWAARGQGSQASATEAHAHVETAAVEPSAAGPTIDHRKRAERQVADPTLVHRRTVLKVLAAAAAVPTLGCEPTSPSDGDASTVSAPDQPLTNPHSLGTPTDPDLLSPVIPWDMLLTENEMRTVAALADVIIPSDDRSPSASAVGAHNFVNEWVSAPYDGQREDLVLVRGGLIWLDTESAERFDAPFSALDPGQQRAICDDIAYLPEAAPEYRAAARFFDKMRDLVSTGFWTTPEGMADLGYVGNVPLASFDGPPAEVLDRLGLT